MLDEQSTEQDTAALARLLKDGRAAKGWTLRQAAKETGISNGYLSLIEQGDVKAPSPKYLSVLAEKYGLAFERLMALAGHPSGPSPVWLPTGAAGSPLNELEPSRASDVGAGGAVYGADTAGERLIGAFGPPVRGLADSCPRPGDGVPESPQADERYQLTTLVVDDLRTLSAGDIAQVRAFISGLRAARRS